MLNLKDLFDKAIEASESYADKDHAAGVLEDGWDAMKGIITAELKAKGESVTLIPQLVKKDPRWRESANNYRDAKKAAMIARMKYDQICRYQENLRTNEVTNRRLTT